ncbi:MAG: amidohydrolase [Saprospiraceae bacterium]
MPTNFFTLPIQAKNNYPMRIAYFFILVFSSFFFIQSCTQEIKETPKATLLLVNGQIWTADSTQTQAEAVAIHDDRILYVGTEQDARAFCNDSTEVIDLEGAFVMPGLIEGHGHFHGLGRSLETINLLYTANFQEIVEQVGEAASQTPEGEWIEGRGWHQEKWDQLPGRTVNGYPFHDALSAVSPDHPVVLKHASGHALMANQHAMQLAGISGETPDPVGGRIVRDASGQLTGVFEENAMDLINKPFKEWQDQRSEEKKQADFDKTIQLATQACLKYGITSFQDAGSNFWTLDQYTRLAESNQLGIRLWTMVAQPVPSEFGLLQNYPKRNLGEKHKLSIGGVKAYLDGALGSYGAWLLEAYDDKPDFFGQNVTPLDTIDALAAICKDRGLQLCVHAIGDRGNRETLNIFEKNGAGSGDLRWRIEHAQHLDSLDILRFSQLGVIASMQAIHCTSDAPFVVKRLGFDRARIGAYAWRSLLDSGAHIANGTDTPVEEVNPLACLYASCTRNRPNDGLIFFPEQAMSREEALYSYTLWNAYAVFQEQEKGSLQAGKLADLAIFDTNLLNCTPEDLLNAQVLYTILGGKIVHRQ